MSAVLAPVETPAIPPDQVFTPGVRTDISHSDYLAIEALSASGIKRLLQSPLHYRYDRDNPSEPTAALAMGTALHMGILEPDRFDGDAIAVIPDDAPNRPSSRQIKAAKPGPATIAAIDWWERFDADAQGRTVLTESQSAIVRGMVGSVRRHPLYEDLFAGDGASEVTYQWHDARHGEAVPCKCRYDRLQRSGLIVDIKTTRDASPEAFARAVGSYGYHVQEAHYRTGFEHLHTHSPDGFLFVAVENEAPFGCAIYTNLPNAVMFGLDQCERAMLLYAQARKTGYWRGYPETIAPVILPRWAVSIPTPEYGNF